MTQRTFFRGKKRGGQLEVGESCEVVQDEFKGF